MSASSLVVLCNLLIGQACPVEDVPADSEQAAAPILIDWIHANDFSMIGLRPGIYEYHATAGFRHGFEFLQSEEIDREYITEGRLTPERLAQHKLLFINLVSAEREPFLVSEIFAIRDWVQGGGSLLVVMDHSNCYFHSHRLKPLLAVLGIAAFVETVCEEPPSTLGGGPGWIAVTEFTNHPITKGLQRIAMQTGGRVDPRYAVAWSSDQSWADQWIVGIYGETKDIGYYGDFNRDEHELPGPHGVVLAREFDEGRIVIVGDQNMWGDGFINYADNYRLWLNSMAWLLRDPEIADWKAYEQWHGPRIVLFEPGDAPCFGSAGTRGYYHLMSLLARHYWTFTNDRLDEPADLRVVVDDEKEFSREERARLSTYVRAGGKLLVLPHAPLETEEGRTAQRQRASWLDVSGSERSTTEHTTEYSFPGGGRVVLLAEDQAPHNDLVAPPTRMPNADEGKREAVLLEIVRQLMGH